MANLIVEEAINYLNGNGEANAMLGIQQIGTLACLHNLNTHYLSSKSPYSGNLNGKGTLNWKIPHLLAIGRYDPPSTKVQTAQFDEIVSKNIERLHGKFKDERFDRAMISPDQAVAIATQIVSSLGVAYAASLNFRFWLKFHKYFENHPEQTLMLPKLAEKAVLSEDEARDIQVELAHKQNDLTKIYNSTSYGVNPDEYRIVINGAGAINLAQLLTRLNNSVRSFEVAEAMINNTFNDGVANPDRIIGGKYIIDNMVGLAIENVIWDEDKQDAGESFANVDFTKNLGYIFHKDFIAFPELQPLFSSTIEPYSDNVIYHVKGAYTSAYLRPLLACAIVSDFRAGVEHGKYEIAVKQSVALVGNAYFDAANVKFTSGDSTIATVSGDKLTGVKAGTVEITATYKTYTYKFKVKVNAAN